VLPGERLSDPTRAHLAALLRAQIAIERERHFKAERPFEWLFSSRDGKPLDETRVRKRWKAAVKAAGLSDRFTVHSLRHSYASQMLMKGAPITWVSQQLGHASVQTTLDYYAWALPQGDNRLASLLDPVTSRDQTGSGGKESARKSASRLEPALGIEPRTC
jgi:integrase